MASRGGFLVRDSALRSRHPIKYHNQPKVHRKKKKKPDWDDTVNDLTAHKATKEEQERRRQLHKSKNVVRVQQELKEKKQKKVTSPVTPESTEQRKLAIFHEVLYGRGDQLQDVLAESDQTLSVVKDIFGDDPKKYLGFPNVTVAPPQNEAQNVSHEAGRVQTAGPVAGIPDTPTHLSLLSDSVMRTPALNEFPDGEEGLLSSAESVEVDQNGNESMADRTEFEPRLDLNRFQQFVSDERGKDAGNPRSAFVSSLEGRMPTVTRDPAPAGSAHPMHLLQAREAGPDVQAENLQPSFMSQESGVTVIAGGPSVMKYATAPASTGEVITVKEKNPSNNRTTSRDTRHVKQSCNNQKTKDSSPPVAAGRGLKNLDDLKKMVESLETEISDYERETGRQPSVKTVEAGSFTGYTAALVTSITKLMSYLKESEAQRRAEMVMRESIIEGFSEQRALVDALTNDIIQTQEHNMRLQEELGLYKSNTDKQLQYLKRELYTVLKSYEYQALSSTMDTLYSLKPLHHNQKSQPTSALHQDGSHNEYLPGAPQLVKLVGQTAAVNPSSFIPVTSPQKDADVTTTPGNGQSDLVYNTVVSGSGVPPAHGNRAQLFTVGTARGQDTGHSASLHSKQMTPADGNPLSDNVQPSLRAQNLTHTQGLHFNGPIRDHSLAPSNGSIYGPSRSPQRPLTDQPQTLNGPYGVQQGQALFHDPSLRTESVVPSTWSPICMPQPYQSTTTGPLGNYQSHVLSDGSTLGHQLSKSSPQSMVKQSQIVPEGVPAIERRDQGVVVHQSMHAPPVSRGFLPEGSKTVTSAGNSHNAQSEVAASSQGVTFGRGLLGGPLMNGDLRQKLQNMANRQRSGGVPRGNRGVATTGNGTAPVAGTDTHYTSPHVHFHEPLVVHNFPGAGSMQGQWPSEVSPAVSPIPYKDQAIHNPGALPEKRVVVNVPRVWQD